MLKLIRNEYAKVFIKKSTYVILAICLLMAAGLSTLIQFAFNEFDEYFYEEEWSIDSELNWYADSEYIYDKIYYETFSLYKELGYEYLDDVPEWIVTEVDQVMFQHYAYVLISESKDIEEAEMELGMSLDDVDLDYEKKLSEEMLAAIKTEDYRSYYEICLKHFDYQKNNNLPYEQSYYEYYKYMVEKEIDPETDEERMGLLNQYIYAKVEYDQLVADREAGGNVSEYKIETAKKSYTIYKHIIDNDIKSYLTEIADEEEIYLNNNKFIPAITSNAMIAGMAGIFVMIIAAGIVANEFSNGTIKFLLINPVTRAKIFWSKYITCITLLVASLVSFFILYFLFCLLICGADGLNGVYIGYADGVVYEQSIITYALEQYALSGVSLLVSVTLAFTASSLLRSTAIAVTLSLIIEFAGATITLFLYELGHDWARYFIFANTDLASIAKGQSMFLGQSFGFAITTIVVYMAIFLLTAYDGFTKKEV